MRLLLIMLNKPTNGARLSIAAFMALYIAGYAWTAPHTDSADELMRGYEIARGLSFPLQGPPLGQVLHLGPAWFYLVAFPLLFWKSWLAGALFVGFVASLKFPLAYLCGKRLLNPGFGLLWAAALLMPGWTTLEQLVFLNPNAVATAILGVVALSLRACDDPRLVHIAALGLLLAIAAHVHPNAAPAALAVLPVAVRFHRRGGSALKASAVFVAAFALPFLPYLYLQATSGYPDLDAASRYVGGEITARGLLNAPVIAWHYMATGPSVIAEYLGGWTHAISTALGLTLAAVHACALVAALMCPEPRVRPLAISMLCAIVIFSAWIGAMRVTTPLQFAWALGPAFAGLLALGIYSASRARGRDVTAAACMIALAFAHATALRWLATRVEDGEGRLPSLVMDIKGRLPKTEYTGGWFPAWAHDSLGRFLCASRRPVVLHGHLGFLVDQDLGLDMLFQCGHREGVSLRGGPAGARHVLGMSRPFWRAAGTDPECVIGSLGLSTRLALPLDQEPLAVAAGETYLPRKYSGNAPREYRRTFDAPPSMAVLVTNLLGNYEHFAIQQVQLDGATVQASVRNDWAALYVPGQATQAGRWTLTFTASEPHGIDVVLVDRSPRSRRCDLPGG